MTLTHSRLFAAGLAAAIAIATIVLATYLAVRLIASAGLTGSPPLDLALGVLLVSAELFVGVQAAGYLISMVKASRLNARRRPTLFAAHADAPVAVLVTSFNEAEEVLEETLSAVRAMDYPRFTIYMLDDSTTDASRAVAARLAERYGAVLVQRANRAGYKAGAINDLLPTLSEPYIAVLDADQRPAHSWLREVVPLLEANPRLAMAQAPQVYVNLHGLPVARAAAYQQAVFYEYICEGKSWSNAMFCCGSNVVLRRAALLAIAVEEDGRRQYFDETSVTEDFATSLRLHAAGWETAYVNRTYVVGMGPETLAAYFTQQLRWALGTLGIFLRMLRLLVRHPRRLRPGQWWEYLLSGSYYLVGVANLIFMAASVAFLLFAVAPVRMDAQLYVALFAPYFLFTMSVFFVGLRLRQYRVRDLWLGTALTFGTFWVHVQAAALALIGRKRAFGVTPKAVGGRLSLTGLLPQITMFTLCAGAAITGAVHMAIVEVRLAHVVTTFWAAYHAALLATLLLYFNRPVTIAEREPLFVPARAAAR